MRSQTIAGQTVKRQDLPWRRDPAPGGVQAQPVLHVLHVVPQLAIGGTELALARLIAGLDRSFFRHSVCAMRGCSDLELWTRELGARPFVLDPVGRRLRFPLVRLIRLMRDLRPDVVHSRNWGSLEAVVAARIAGGCAVAHSEHGYDHAMLRGMPLRRRLFRRSAYTLTDGLCAVSAELSEYHAEKAWVSRRRFQVVHNGVDLCRFGISDARRALIRRELGIGHDEFVVGWVGRMEPIKDVPTLLRACASLSGRWPRLRVLLVGTGSERQRWEAEAQNHGELRNRVLFVGERRDIPEMLSAMDVFALPSISEGISNTLLEAMASYLPILATSAGGNPEVVEEGVTGWLFASGDDRALARWLEELLSSPERRVRMGHAARRRAEEHFSLRGMVEQYAQLYLDLAQLRGKGENVRN